MKKYLLLVLTSVYYIVSAQLTPIQPYNDIDAFTSVVVEGQTILLATDQNKILKSSDGGATWKGISGNVPVGINKLHSPVTSIIFGSGNGGAIIRSTDSGETWTRLNSGTNTDLFDLTSVNSTTLFACGKAGIILKSTDGGDSWASATPTQFNINAIKFGSHLNGWAACDNGIILKTTDGGVSWFKVPGASANCNFGVISTYGLDGVAVFGREGQVLQSTNGGVDWKYEFQDFYMVGDTVIAAWHYGRDTVVYADDRGALCVVVIKPDRLYFDRFGTQSPKFSKYLGAFKTEDKQFLVAGFGPNLSKAYLKGNVWTSLLLSLKGKELWNIKFADDKVGIVCGYPEGNTAVTEAFVYVTTDGGVNWKHSASSTYLRNVQVLSSNNLYRTDFKFSSSRDSGKTWQTRSNPPGGIARDVVMVDTLNGYLITYYTFPTPSEPKGKLFSTTNSGYSWVDRQDFQYYWVHGVFADKNGRVWITEGETGKLYVSLDYGVSNVPVDIQPYQNIVSANIGESGYVIYANGRIYFTSSSGYSWSMKYNVPGIRLNGVSNTIDGYSLVVGDVGTILVTSDYGNSWQTITSGMNLDLTSVYLMPDYSFIVGTRSGEVYKGVVITDVENESLELPVDFTLGNYPNPFNGSTVIHFSLPADSECKLEVFSPIGSRVFEADIKGLRGNNSYNFDATSLNSGVYLYRLNAGGGSLTGKMILLK